MPQFASDLAEVVQRAGKQGVAKIITCGFDLASSLKNIEIAEKFPAVFAALGIHPHDAEKYAQDDLKKIREALGHPKVKAIGETGLDYFKNYSDKEAQKKLFYELLKIGAEKSKPIIIHSRSAGEDTLKILEEFPEIKKIVFHCFPDDAVLAAAVLKRGYLISFTATITFKNASPELKKIVAEAPLEKIMIETDCPYLAPQARRGQRNEPGYVTFVAEKIAEIKKIPLAEVAEKTSQNAVEFFNL